MLAFLKKVNFTLGCQSALQPEINQALKMSSSLSLVRGRFGEVTPHTHPQSLKMQGWQVEMRTSNSLNQVGNCADTGLCDLSAVLIPYNLSIFGNKMRSCTFGKDLDCTLFCYHQHSAVIGDRQLFFHFSHG